MTARTNTVETEETVEVEGTGLPSVRAKTPEEITKVVAELERIQTTARDYVVPAAGLSVIVSDEGVPQLTAEHGGVVGTAAYGITTVAHAQIAAKLDIPGKYYKRMLATEPALLATNANTWLAQTDRKFLVRTIDGNARAVLSNGFRPMDGGDLFFGKSVV